MARVRGRTENTVSREFAYGNLILWREVRCVYTRRGAWIWLRHHRRQGTSLTEQRRLIHALATGAFA